MSVLIGFNAFGDGSYLASDLPPINNINDINLTDSQFTGLFVRQNTSNVDETSAKETWGADTILNATFKNTLEAGNISNQGVPITSMRVKRRSSNSTTNQTVSTISFTNDTTIEFKDATTPMGEYVYQIVPVGVNGIEGIPNEISVTSDFYGWWLVDKDTMATYQFDLMLTGAGSAMNANGYVGTTLNQGRVVIETLSRFPQVYYTPKQYHEFSLQAAFYSDTYTWDEYQRLVDMITSHKPLLVKSGSGDYYVVDVYAPSKQTLLNAYQERDYGVIQISVTEIMTYDDWIALPPTNPNNPYSPFKTYSLSLFPPLIYPIN